MVNYLCNAGDIKKTLLRIIDNNVAFYQGESLKTQIANSGDIDEESKIELLKKYKELLEQGIITEDEFNKKKDEILNK